MSKSIKKTPICGNVKANSEKKDKRLANRQFRRVIRCKELINDESLPELKELSHIWSFEKDGKNYFGNIDDSEKLNRLMRK